MHCSSLTARKFILFDPFGLHVVTKQNDLVYEAQVSQALSARANEEIAANLKETERSYIFGSVQLINTMALKETFYKSRC